MEALFTSEAFSVTLPDYVMTRSVAINLLNCSLSVVLVVFQPWVKEVTRGLRKLRN